MLYCLKVLKYFLPILLAFFSGAALANCNMLVYSIMSVGFFLYLHYVVNIEHRNNNRFLFFGIFAFVVLDLQRSAILGVNLIPFCISSALFCYLTDKKYFSHNKWPTVIAAVCYVVCGSWINDFTSNYFDIQLLALEFFLLSLVFVVMFLFYYKLSNEDEINYLQS